MRDVRIESTEGGRTLLIDIVCDCGGNGLMDSDTGEKSFKHAVQVGIGPDKILVCLSCMKKYRIHPQGTHVHIFSQ